MDIIGDLDNLLTSVEHIARGKAGEVIGGAHREAQRIVDEGRHKADRHREQVLEQARAQAHAIEVQRTARGTHEQLGELVRYREEQLERVWQQAEQRLKELCDRPDEYRKALKSLAFMAFSIIGAEHIVLASDSRGGKLLDQNTLEAWSSEASDGSARALSFTRAAEPIDEWGGLKAFDANSRKRVDAAFPVRLRLAREEIREDVFSFLVQT